MQAIRDVRDAYLFYYGTSSCTNEPFAKCNDADQTKAKAGEDSIGKQKTEHWVVRGSTDILRLNMKDS